MVENTIISSFKANAIVIQVENIFLIRILHIFLL